MQIKLKSALVFIKPDGHTFTMRFNKGILLKTVIYSLLMELSKPELEDFKYHIDNILQDKKK